MTHSYSIETAIGKNIQGNTAASQPDLSCRHNFPLHLLLGKSLFI